MKTLITLVFYLIFSQFSIAQNGFVIDHRHADLAQIPESYINLAKQNLKIRYFRRSHGSQIDIGGMAALRRFSSDYNTLYSYNSTGANGELFLDVEWHSLDIENSTWVQITRDYLNNAANSQVNVVMWAWSSGFFDCDVDQYLSDMEMLIGEYGPVGSMITSGQRTVPVTFVFQTACGQSSTDRNQLVYEGNKQIRQFCVDNNRILFDFNDIECYNPDNQYFGDGNPDGSYTNERLLNDDLSYNVASGRGNWGIEWNNANPTSELKLLSADNICTECAHSMGEDEGEIKDNSRLHCVLKGRAAWWLWAKLAGWGVENASSQSSTSESLSENNLNGAVINFSLFNETFADNNLSAVNFILNNAPNGTAIESIDYINSTHADINLSFNGTDFDTNYNNFSITVLNQELIGNNNLQSNSISIDAVVEDNPSVNISSATQLTESNLDNAIINLSLNYETFADNNLSTNNFILNNIPNGTAIESIDYINSTHADVNLSFDGTDFDTDINNFSITVLNQELNGNNNLQSNSISIFAEDENSASAIAIPNQELSESNLENSEIAINLTNETFSLTGRGEIESFVLNNAPAGLSIETISQISDSEINLQLSFSGQDFDNDIDDFSITILSNQLTGNQDLTTNNLSIEADINTKIIDDFNREEKKISLFPNPNNGIFYLKFNSNFYGKVTFVILNQSGTKVYENNFNVIKGEQTLSLDLQKLKKGVYLIYSDIIKKSRKIIIK
ncbi:MAG: T9SS type A sorting domain-containing protein [Bacteroidales bacterium]|nr:T9SS type A sorting domain-containing protein [Bacteroidales bacterium]MBN2758747.1 T9SS type A sorting domain-containing protein [Bacteroidales bacterium]